MGKPRRIRRTIFLFLAFVVDLLLLVVLAARPPRVYSNWLGLVGDHEDAPIRLVGRWLDGQLAPLTVTGFVSLFTREDLVVGFALLSALVVLTISIAMPWTGSWLTSRFGASVRMPKRFSMRLGVRAVLVLIAVLGCGLGWEFNAWKSWRLRQGYLHQAAIHAAEERLYQSQLKHYVKEDVAPPTPSENEIRTAPAYAARWAANRDQSRRFSAYVTAMATAHARLRRKYEQATANPLEPVEPDPPLPQQEPEADSWLARRDYARALAAYGEQIRLYPEFDHAYERRAWIWATCPDPQFRDGRLAVESATRACELTNWKAAAVLDTLATAYAESGDFEAAVKWQRKALELAPTRAWKGYQEDRLALYMAGKPYRQAR